MAEKLLVAVNILMLVLILMALDVPFWVVMQSQVVRQAQVLLPFEAAGHAVAVWFIAID